ncbi:MAG TPA: stalk domain-containing protein, partial [Caldisericia bacterium]|nr:stalk domain-containing protein [Caldisericia bacterium]
FPNDYVLPGSIKPKMITVNGTPLNKPPQVVKTLNQVTITSPVAINNLSEVAVVFSDKIGMKNPVKIADYTLKVKTDSEPETIESEPFKVATVPVVEVNPNMEYNTAEYYAVGILPADSPIKSGQEFTVNFPKGTSIPKTIQPSSVIINGQPYKGTVNTGSETISLVAPSDIVGALKVRFLVSSGIKNTAPGTYELTFTTGGKSFTFEKFEIIKSKPIIANVDITEEQGCEQSGYKFTYIPSFAGDLNPGDKLTVEFPENTRLPQAVSGDKVTIGGKPSQAVEIDGLKLVITVDTEVKAANGGALVDITKDAGVINTNYPGGYSLKVSTNKDEPISSPQFTITMPKVTSQLAFKDPAQPDGLEFEGCLWYKTPPVLSITSCNPYAKIFMWYDNKTDSIVQYTGEKRLSPASQRTTIWYYAQVGDVKEEPKPMKLCLDTILPSFSVIQPDMEKTITNKKTYTIKGERQPTEMLTDGDNEKYQVVDGVYINGKQLLSPEIFETANRDSIKMTFEATVDLKEGENVVEIKGIDQAGNERTIKKIIILDTKAPEIVVVKPDPKELQKPGENIAIQVKSETDASVFINGQIAQKIEELPDGKTAIFEAGWDVVKGENKVEITSTDVAGNTATTYLTFKGATVIELWLEKTDFVVNGENMPSLATAPTIKSPPLPKVFAGTTFMPIADVAKALGVEVKWDQKTKMVTLTQTLENGTKKVIQLWINKKQAKIDGKDVWIDAKKVLYPTILSGKTLLPLRFVGDALGALVEYDTKTKKITLTYPKP